MTILEIFSIQTLHLIVKQLLEKNKRCGGKITKHISLCFVITNLIYSSTFAPQNENQKKLSFVVYIV